jgi:hypothetical protein
MCHAYHSYWTKRYVLQLARAQCFDSIANVALSVLDHMHTSKSEPIVQVCGPMTTGGYVPANASGEERAIGVEKNYAYFRSAIDILIADGWHVFDQLPIQEAMVRVVRNNKKYQDEEYCTDILEIFYRKIFESGYIKKGLFIHSWKSSRGATWERSLLKKIHIPVRPYPQELVERVLLLTDFV